MGSSSSSSQFRRIQFDHCLEAIDDASFWRMGKIHLSLFFFLSKFKGGKTTHWKKFRLTEPLLGRSKLRFFRNIVKSISQPFSLCLDWLLRWHRRSTLGKRLQCYLIVTLIVFFSCSCETINSLEFSALEVSKQLFTKIKIDHFFTSELFLSHEWICLWMNRMRRKAENQHDLI